MATIVDYLGGLVLPDTPVRDSAAVLAGFRRDFYQCLVRRADALFELTDAVLCADGPVRSLVELTLAAEHRRGHGALYDALNSGRVDVARLRAGAGRAAAAPGRRRADRARGRCQPVAAPGRADQRRTGCSATSTAAARASAQMIPGWPYSFVAALETGRTSWTAVLDAVRLGPGRRRHRGHRRPAPRRRRPADRGRALARRRPGHPDRVRHRLRRHPAGLPAGRPARASCSAGCAPTGSCALPAPRQRRPGDRRPPAASTAPSSPWPSPTTWPAPHARHHAPTPPATAPPHADRLGPAAPPADPPRRLARPRRRAADHRGHPDPAAGRPPARRPRPRNRCGCGPPPPAPPPPTSTAAGRPSCAASTSNTPSGCSSRPSAGPAPKIRDPDAADRWTWLIIAAHTQLRLARALAADLRRPWERPAAPGRLTPARVRRGFRNIRPKTTLPGQRTETQPTRPRTPTRLPQPTARTPPRRRQDRQTRPDHHRTQAARRLKIKLRGSIARRPSRRCGRRATESQ